MTSTVAVEMTTVCVCFRERQQQLEELTKELGRIQDEADSLRMKLKQFKSSKVRKYFLKFISWFDIKIVKFQKDS